jgi:hypothetical protein
VFSPAFVGPSFLVAPGPLESRQSKVAVELRVSSEDLEEYESDVELQLYREYKDVCPMFRFVVETERRFYLANEVNQSVVNENGRTRVEIELRDAWVWDMYRQNRFVSHVRVVTFKDVNIEELPREELRLP